MAKRENRLQVLLTEEERDRINKAAEARSIGPSTYVRMEALAAAKRDEVKEGK